MIAPAELWGILVAWSSMYFNGFHYTQLNRHGGRLRTQGPDARAQAVLLAGHLNLESACERCRRNAGGKNVSSCTVMPSWWQLPRLIICALAGASFWNSADLVVSDASRSEPRA